jgi:6-pyruvoyltetrahydropterin/6-carboxytetrahydropterin synthase
MTEFSIRIASPNLIFSAAHFITFDGGGCEPLHGHDYRVQAELFGPLNASGYVVDFVLVEKRLRAIVEELDHRVLLPGEHSSIVVAEENGEMVVVHAGRRWIFPADNCRVLPVKNTTTESFARYIGERLIDDLIVPGRLPVGQIVVEVGECGGYGAVCRLEIAESREDLK